MTILEMIATWRKGCSCSMVIDPETGEITHTPWTCQPCTKALVDAIERKAAIDLNAQLQTEKQLASTKALLASALDVLPKHRPWNWK